MADFLGGGNVATGTTALSARVSRRKAALQKGNQRHVVPSGRTTLVTAVVVSGLRYLSPPLAIRAVTVGRNVAFSHTAVVRLPCHRSSSSGTLHTAMSWGSPAVATSAVGRGDDIPAPYQPKKRKGRLVTVIILILIFAGLLVGLITAFPRQFIHQVEISVVRQPTPYTQLFFSNPAMLPSVLHIDRRNTFIFTIVNDQGRSQLYRYTVTMSTTGSSTVASKGSLAISNGRSVTRAVAVVPRSRRSRFLISVVINATGQSIHFYGYTP